MIIKREQEMNSDYNYAIEQAKKNYEDTEQRGSDAIGKCWEDVRTELFKPEELAINDLRVAIIGELIKARQKNHISQKQLEELSGVKQPVIARMENGSTDPQIETVLKVLAPLGMTLAVVPLKNSRNSNSSL